MEGYTNMLKALTSSPDFGPETNVLMDFTAVDVSGVTAAEMEEIAYVRARFAADNEGNARSAMVVGRNSPLKYGLGRMFKSYVLAQVNVEIGIFETFDEAMAWLRGGDADPAS